MQRSRVFEGAVQFEGRDRAHRKITLVTERRVHREYARYLHDSKHYGHKQQQRPAEANYVQPVSAHALFEPFLRAERFSDRGYFAQASAIQSVSL